jgi:putative flippase GtrA
VAEPRGRGSVARESKRLLKFLTVGAAAFVVETTALSVFVLVFSIERLTAKALAFALAVLSSYLGNSWWAFRESRSKSRSRQLVEFIAISVIGLAVNLSVFGLFDRLLSPAFGPTWALYAAHAAAVGVAMSWNFLANRMITYGDIRFGV